MDYGLSNDNFLSDCYLIIKKCRRGGVACCKQKVAFNFYCGSDIGSYERVEREVNLI